MDFKEHRVKGGGKVEVRLYFQSLDHHIVLERVYVPADGPQNKLLDLILYVWGNSPDVDEVSFIMAQDETGAVIVTRKSLLIYVDHNKHLYGG